jgi:hypothetical protein
VSERSDHLVASEVLPAVQAVEFCRPGRPDRLQGLRRLTGKEQSSYKITKNGKVFAYWHGTQGKREIVLEGARAASLRRDLPTMNPEEQQLAVARATGDFKRGNERRSGNV